ncbi:hypothetical protein [Ferruginibacter albus]|uniref:hypothetical protein n=1 Tax=Ferruginibacter albus TaxID=2875540 RepID=UPI001CC5EDA6|nr:hypothetical protein [Ferruginibacter albus]UAY50911.1 hypothetical protein K9M53_09945 [Ferruginibacter albus]
MRKFFYSLCVITLISSHAFSQDLLDKIPVTASVVIKYSGTSLSAKLPAKKFDSYTILKKNIFSELKINKKLSLDDLGINMQQDAYQYFISTDTTKSFVTILPIKDLNKFEKFIATRKKSVSIETKDGFKFLPLSHDNYLGWNKSFVTLVIQSYSSYNNPYSWNTSYPRRYNDYPAADSTMVDSVKVVADTAAVAVDTVMSGKIAAPPVIDAGNVIEQKMADEKPPMADSTAAAIIPQTDSTTISNNSYNDSAYEAQAALENLTKKTLALALLENTFTGSITSFKTNSLLEKVVNKNADIYAWLQPGMLLNNLYSPYRYSPYNYSYYNRLFNFNFLQTGIHGVSLFFENNRLRVESKFTSSNDSIAKAFNSIYDNKQNADIVNYVSPGDLGYISLSFNTESLMNFYYDFYANLFGSFYGKNKQPLVDAIKDIVATIVDEKAIANTVTGNHLFVLHGLTNKEVTYTDYTYDENYNSFPVLKTKTELSPDFTYVFETKNEKLFNKLIDLPVKLNTDSSYKYKKTGNFYTLDLGPNEAIDKLYFMVGNGKCIITTSLKDVTNPIPTSSLNNSDKLAILNNNYLIKLDGEKLLKGFSSEISNKRNAKSLEYLENNVGNVTIESAVKDGMIQSSGIFDIKGNHKNSLEYIFNVIETLLEMNK